MSVEEELGITRAALRKLVDVAATFLLVCDNELDLDDPDLPELKGAADELEDMLMASRRTLDPERQ